MVPAVEPAHDEYGASSAKRWTSCLGSVRLCAMCPSSQDSEWGEEGRDAHSLLEFCLVRGYRSARVNEILPFSVTNDMARSVQRALDWVYEILDANPGSLLSVENRVKVPNSVAPGRMGGTCDIRIYVPQKRWMIIADYKHGAGIYVEAEDNLQMDMYAIGSLFQLNEAVERITCAIIQPRYYSSEYQVRQVEREMEDLMRVWTFFEQQARLAQSPDAPLVPHPDNCRWCPAGGYGVCSVGENLLKQMVDPNATSLQTVTLPDGKTMSKEQMGYFLAHWPLIKALAKNIEMTATGFVRNGGNIPGFKLVDATSERGWHGNEDQIGATLASWLQVPIDEVMPRRLIGIVEAEQKLKAMYRNMCVRVDGETKKAFNLRQNKASEIAAEAMANLTLREPRGQPRLVPLSDPRRALETSVPHLAGRISVEGL